MASKADFTEQEWEALQKGVSGSALLVSIADRGFFDSFKEAGAVGKHVSEARKNNPSPLVQEVAQMRGTGFGLRTSTDEVEKETTEALTSATSILQAKAADDLPAYRDFVLEVAQSVAAAAKDVGAAETDALEKIRAALESGSSAPPVA
jgi:hypothetical protein